METLADVIMHSWTLWRVSHSDRSVIGHILRRACDCARVQTDWHSTERSGGSDMYKKVIFLGSTLVLGACQSALDTPMVSRFFETEAHVIQSTEGPPDAVPGSCWGRDVTPALVETVTERILLQPAELATDGKVLAPAIYKTETKQRITKERDEIWFETPCPEAMTPEFGAALQRALRARGYFRGALTSEMDRSTRRAIRFYQRGEGLDSPILSLAAARKLGLVIVPAPSARPNT